VRYLSLFSGIEAASVAWHPLGWTPVAFAEIEPFPSAVLAERFPGVPNFGDVLLSGEALASHSASQDLERDWMILAATSHSHILQLLISIAPNGSFGKMSPVSCHPTEEGTLEASLGRWMKSGMGMRGVCWTLNMSEHPTIRGLSLNDEGVSSLSEILETQVVPQRFYLTPKACLGILRRAERRGKTLPPLLQQALREMAL
jgi:hypothetical protein